MFKINQSFCSFSTDDMKKAQEFYGQTLGLEIEQDDKMGVLDLHLKSCEAMIYPKKNHAPASYTVLNFLVDNIDQAVNELTAKGVKFEIYDAPGIETDAAGISRHDGQSMAWFKDPAGNILSLLQTK